MLNWLKDSASSVRQGLQNEVGKFKNREFMEAVVAGCAIVAAADGDISGKEKQKMIGFMQSSDELKVFKVEDVIAFFNQMAAKFEFDREIGRAEALKVIGKLKKNEGAARIMVRVCCVIGGSDGTFDEAEKTAVRGICVELGLSPAEFEL
ncbi:MAG: tellurite resistance TerB family protein [Hyphomicrobium sp.]|nr:tellurite resistance TerB family protein [Hyphomicrobium sp.]